MAGGGRQRADHRKVAAEPLRRLQFLQTMAGRGDAVPRRQRARVELRQLLRPQMHADAQVLRQRQIAIDQHLRAARRT